MASVDPLLTRHAAHIRANAFVHAIYLDVYRRILAEVPPERYPRLLEIGSGAGFFAELAPHVLTSDCVPGPGIARVVDACDLGASFTPGELDGVVAFDVFHHLPNAEGFLRGAETVLAPGGRIVLVEPWFTPVGQWFFRLIHPEPAVMDPEDWGLRGAGRLGGANSRLPTSVFQDGLARLARVAPSLSVVGVTPFHKWLYLLSGGLRLNTRVPRPLVRALMDLDRRTASLDDKAGILAVIVVERTTSEPLAAAR